MSKIILVHGAMHGAWCWEHVVPALVERGHVPKAIDLPGLGADKTPAEEVTADDWADAVASAIRESDGPVILVGHSMGGTAVAEGAERMADLVDGLIFVSAFMIEAGQTIFGACPEVMEIAKKTALDFPNDPAGSALRMFYGSTDPIVARAAIARLRVQPDAIAASPLRITAERFGRLPRAYIECTDDAIFPLAVQRRMQDRLPCRPVVTMASDHSPFLSAPGVLADHIDTIARGFSVS